jgi:hypothetical protein
MIVDVVKPCASRLLPAIALMLLIFGCSATPPLRPLPAIPESPENEGVFDHSHRDFDSLLKKFVGGGLVDYRGLQTEADLLYRYTDSLAGVDQTTVQGWSPDRQLAFWINAYNALTIQAIVRRYPIRSRSLVGLFFPRNSILQISGIWNRLTFDVGGRSLTLGEIEHEILRKNFEEPKIHFAIVCASSSCPRLRPEAYRFDILQDQLHDQAVQFINDPIRGVRFDAEKKRLHVSKIFKWFKDDFESNRATGNPIIAYIRPYLKNDTITEALAENQDIRLSYLPYDWSLNEQTHANRPATPEGDRDGRSPLP